MNFKNFIFLGALAFVAVIGFEGCNKKEDTIAKIYVRDADMLLVPDARVILYGTSTTNQPSNVTLFDTTVTNSAGEAIFNLNEVYQLGQSGVAVLNIDVDKDGKFGQGIIKVEQETTSEETVYIQ
jgi:hypothetical protein